MDTSAAIPSIMDEMKRKSLDRFRLLSRHAIVKIQAHLIFPLLSINHD
jgi:hypothetical protein